ncbi:hypothetical protein K439DRAFT_419459 [Ramaria rubella]|nr:hypothetical protein K439DRAFT_419459 [Ramaria rubella]
MSTPPIRLPQAVNATLYSDTSYITREIFVDPRREVRVSEYSKGVKGIYFTLTVTIPVLTSRHIPFSTIYISLEAQSRSSVSGYFCVPPARIYVGVRNICNSGTIFAPRHLGLSG